MILSITSQVNTAVGLQVTGMIGNIVAHTDTLLTTGIIQCDIEFYANQNAKDKAMNPLFPIILDENGFIQSIIASCKITLTEEEVNAANLPNTIYTKTAEKLNADYGWTVVVV